jgi:hypothetical protein
MTPEVTKIGNKLFDKVELASQRIDLGLIDDINKLKIEANNIEDSAVSEIKKSISILDNASNILDKAILSSKSVIDQIDKAKIMAKELGIDLPNNIDASYKYYQDNIKLYTLMKNTISSFNTKINSI